MCGVGGDSVALVAGGGSVWCYVRTCMHPCWKPYDFEKRMRF